MDKTVNSGDNLCECTEGSDRNNLYLYNIAYCKFSKELCPGVVLCLLSALGISILLGVKALNVNFKLVADRNDLLGVLDSVPGKLCGMNHTVNAA